MLSYSGFPIVLCGRSRVHLGHHCSTPTSPQTSRLVLLEVWCPGTVSGSSITWELVSNAHPQVPPRLATSEVLGAGLEDVPSSKPSRACDASLGVHPTAPGHLFVRQVPPGLQECTPRGPRCKGIPQSSGLPSIPRCPKARHQDGATAFPAPSASQRHVWAAAWTSPLSSEDPGPLELLHSRGARQVGVQGLHPAPWGRHSTFLDRQ